MTHLVSRISLKREVVDCIVSLNTCTHGCLYCYAKDSKDSVKRNIVNYDIDSPLLCSKVLFDLDGTITDSGEGIINSLKYTLKAYRINDYAANGSFEAGRCS